MKFNNLLTLLGLSLLVAVSTKTTPVFADESDVSAEVTSVITDEPSTPNKESATHEQEAGETKELQDEEAVTKPALVDHAAIEDEQQPELSQPQIEQTEDYFSLPTIEESEASAQDTESAAMPTPSEENSTRDETTDAQREEELDREFADMMS